VQVNFLDVLGCFGAIPEEKLCLVFEGLQREGLLQVRTVIVSIAQPSLHSIELCFELLLRFATAACADQRLRVVGCQS
jgi:hypothetical protein